MTDSTPIAQQLIDIHTDANVKSSQFIIETKTQKTQQEYLNAADNETIGAFLNKWINLEKRLKIIWKTEMNIEQYHSSKETYALLKEKGITDKILLHYNQLRKTRNSLVHGIEIPDSVFLRNCMRQIDEVLNVIEKHFPYSKTDN